MFELDKEVFRAVSYPWTKYVCTTTHQTNEQTKTMDFSDRTCSEEGEDGPIGGVGYGYSFFLECMRHNLRTSITFQRNKNLRANTMQPNRFDSTTLWKKNVLIWRGKE